MINTVSFSLDYLRERAKKKPEGYMEDMLAHGTVQDDKLIMKIEDVNMLFEKYNGQVIRSFDQEPGTGEVLSNFFSSVRESVKTGFRRVSAEKHQERLDICAQCRFWRPSAFMGMGKCKKCGCSGVKLWLSTSRCPINKWDSDESGNMLN